MHLCYSPFDDVAKVLVVDVKILAADGPLSTFFELILSVTSG